MSKAIHKQFWRYTTPTIAAMLVNGLYQIVDGIFIGRYIGSVGLAGINLAWPVIGTILGIGMMVGVGTGALTSIKHGEGKSQHATRILTTGLLLLAMLAPIVGGTLYLFSEEFLTWQGGEGEAFELGLQYLDILIYASVFSLGSIALPFLLRNDNSPNVATVLMVVGAVVNIILDYLFIAVLGWELTGAALATGIAQAGVTVLGISYFFSSHAKVRLSIRRLDYDFSVVPNIIFVGLSSFFMYAYGSMMVAIHNGLFTHYGSSVLVGSYAVLGYIVTIYYLTAEGIANGMQPLVSFNFGAKKTQNIKTLLSIAMVSAILGGVIFVVMLNLFPYQSVTIFNDTDRDLIEGAVLGIRLHMFALFLDGFIVVAGAYYQAVNKAGKAMFVMVGNMVVQLPFLYFMPQFMGIEGIWIAYPLSNIAMSIVVGFMMWGDIKGLSKIEPTQ